MLKYATMDQVGLEVERRLAQAKRHVVEGERILAQQRKLVALLQRFDRDPARARDVLGQLEKKQAMLIAERNRLLRVLSAIKGRK